jgi:hypothetical protein
MPSDAEKIRPDFLIVQYEQAMEIFRHGVTSLAQLVTVFVLADITLLGFAIDNQIAGIIFLGALFPIFIMNSASVVGKLLAPTIFTAYYLELLIFVTRNFFLSFFVQEPPMIFEPFTIKNVTFKNRILRSSIGGRTSYYDGTVTPAWKNFEKRFAEGGVAGIISATIGINKRRLSPLEYPAISDDKFIKPFRDGVRAVQNLGCRYIVQIGDPGGHTHTSLFSEAADGKSASSGVDLVYGYRNRMTPMSVEEIEQEVQNFAEAARRVREAECDGVEITASKGYVVR